ncbi:hypothetical protein FAVG1_12474 [Fusarium avenaceum]|nr:hypothetical protein FAVG1_12474 [Fusarium avenaceum]
MITKGPETSQKPTNYQSPIPRLSRLAAETATALRRVLRVPIAARAISELLVTRYLSFHAVTIMEGVSNGPIPSNAGLLIAKCLGLFPQLWSDQAVQPLPLYKQAKWLSGSRSLVSGLTSVSAIISLP